MNTIIAPQTTTTLPPAWAAAHLPTGDGVLHIGAGRTLDVHSPNGSDTGTVYASIEQLEGEGPAIRVQGAADQPFTLSQAWELAAVLQSLVLTALPAVTR